MVPYRYVVGLGFIDTKIIQKGKQVEVISNKVAALTREYEDFMDQLKDELKLVPY